jgi:hypothetical protein
MKYLTCGIIWSALLIAGCSGSSDAPEVAPVSGTLTVGGKPRGDLNVMFYPEGGGRPATGITADDGTFTLTTFNTGDGAPIGTCKVAVTGGAGAQMGETGPPMPGQAGYEEFMKAEAEKIDPKYSDPEKSGLVYTVTEDGFDNLEVKVP